MIQRFALSMAFAFSLAAPVQAQAIASPAPATSLIHGNYCGPGNNAPAAPIDALDSACARHDACTPDGGLATKPCNLRLQREAEAIARDPRQSEDLRAMAGLVSVGASMMLSSRELEAPGNHRLGRPAKSWASYGR
ncbi:hypothetical protein ASF27_20690 [Methylobacterium sp. Leaf102]|jgi:hypothetical protein|uniref:hypothetical protein n=1 Tax=Methylobacterium sp. Leaf102 TaxID=1736253 RepID=UPI0006F97A86|nr:hypothetical protein [Methylobacterium sp. Leaf102]KQP28866.1 hypothetical protein ASF27_20690 [Methylobacterium sp. Leaf102]